MKIDGHLVKRRMGQNLACWNGEIWVDDVIALYHEAGHFADPNRELLETYKDVYSKLGFERPTDQVVRLNLLKAEAFAWRWATRMYTRRGRKLSEAFKNRIRHCYGSYVELLCPTRRDS